MLNWPEEQIINGTILTFGKFTYLVLDITDSNNIKIMDIKTREISLHDIDFLYEKCTFVSSEVGNILYEA